MRLHILNLKKNDLVFFCNSQFSIPIDSIVKIDSWYHDCKSHKKVPQTHIMDLNDKTCKLTPTKKPILNMRLTYLVFNCLKAILCLTKFPFPFMNLGEVCYFDKKPLWKTKKQRDLNQNNIQMQYIESFLLSNHLLKKSTTRHSTQLY
jgi:hypothetical protein